MSSRTVVDKTQSIHEFGSRLLSSFEEYHLSCEEELVIVTNKGAPLVVSCGGNYQKITSRLRDADKRYKITRIYSAPKTYHG